jgi:hypothetical protein
VKEKLIVALVQPLPLAPVGFDGFHDFISSVKREYRSVLHSARTM